MARNATPTWGFAVIIVKKGQRFLVVHERKHGQLWYHPAGRVEPGESFELAAVRETLEEAGIPVTLEGILRVEYSPQINGSARMRVIFLARPADDTPPKSVPDEESLEARWVTMEELSKLPLRSQSMVKIFDDVLDGACIYPLSLLQEEGNPLLPE
jgi:8-oxo-dGTP pyrophosphatase MutT (NUDIX family)